MSAVDFPGIRSNKHRALGWRAFSRLAAVFALVTSLAWAILLLAWPRTPVHVHVRWKPDVTDTQRVELERRFQLTDSQPGDGVTWEYQLVDSSTANIKAIVQNERVDDTAHLNRIRYSPEFAQDRSRQILAYSVGTGAFASLLLLVSAVFFGRTALLSVPSSDLAAAVSARLASMRASGPILQASTTHPSFSRLVTAAVLVTSVLTTVAMTSLAGVPSWSAAAALVAIYVCGYVAGSLLLDRVGTWSWAIVRTVAGFLLTTIGFLLSLVLSLPWFLGPVAVVAAAVWLRGRWAFAWPGESVRLGWDGVAAVMLAVILVSPIAITFFYMAPGNYPPVFYNVDTAPVLEKVHGLVIGNTFPPESLSNIGARRTYHYGTQAMAALISRSSGLLPHHALFLIVLPLLTVGVIAAAFAAARHLSPALPRSVTVPLLLISTPSLSATFWGRFGPQLWAAATSRGFSIDGVIGDFALWGILSNEAKNVGGDFVVLASVAGIAAAPSLGWRLPVFLIGSAVLVKTPAGVALLAGLMLADAWRAVVARRLLPSPQVLIAGTVFLATLVAFFLASSEPNFRVVLSPLYHLRGIVSSGGLSGIAFDLLWLLLPALIVLTARIEDPEKRSAPFLLMGLAPILVVNVTGLEHIAETGGGAGDDWLQILHSVPFLLHAFALSLASWRWAKLGPRRRAAVLLTMALAIVPVVTAAARYSVLLVRNPEGGHEFVDNRTLATALAVIPTRGTVIVTNDLRYPAQNFSRDERQMQIPALFGHQAFAVNYAYEVVPSARERRELQHLLQQPAWSDRILEAARTHRWTHLVIRKDYVHPAPIPLEQIFENEFYAVFRFP
ncbi:MAG: hypothetical protein ABW292_06000 [Vicinamibacterales bacterium]